MSMPPPPPPPGSIPPPPGYQDYRPMTSTPEYAGFGSRLGAFVIDVLIGIAFTIPGNLVSATGAEALGTLVSLAGTIAFLVLYCKKVSQGQSWGQKVTGVRVVDATSGASISAGKVFGRQLAKIVSQIVCFLGFFWMIWDPKKQTWHDKIVSTVVVKA